MTTITLNRGDPLKLPNSHNLTFKTWEVSELDPEVFEGDAVKKLGYEFFWTKHHLKGKDLLPYRKIGDPYVDDILKVHPIKPDQDALSVVLEKAKTEGGIFKDLADHVLTVPEWVDWEKIAKGQEVFHRYCHVAQMGLFYLSLVGGFGAPKINKVLTSTGYLANKNTMRRLLETNQMILDCMEKDGLKPGTGIGWQSALKVRFLHGKVRQRLTDSKRWNVEEWGAPINQEDLIGTQLSFQYNVILTIARVGITLSEEEIENYTHLWRYIGYLSGIKDEYNPCSNFSRSKGFLESVVMHIIEPDESSQFLALHCIEALESDEAPIKLPRATHFQISRMIMGDQLADSLKFPNSRIQKFIVEIFFLIFQLLSRLTFSPIMGKYLVQRNFQISKEITKKGLGGRANFGMTHVPTDKTIDNLERLKSEKEEERRRKARKLSLFSLLSTIAFIIIVIYASQKLRRIRSNK